MDRRLRNWRLRAVHATSWIADRAARPEIERVSPPRSSRQRYRGFVEDYKHRRLDDSTTSGTSSGNGPAPDAGAVARRGKRRQYVREYVRWLKPYRYAVAGLFVLALITAGLQMIEPLFMRFIIDRVLLNTQLDAVTRLTRLNLAGGLFVAVIILSNLVNLTKDYRQRLLNVRVMLSLAASDVRASAAPAAAEAVGHEDGRDPVPPNGRRRHDDWAHADGDRVAGDLDHPAHHRRRRADGAQLAARAHGDGRDPGRDADQLHRRETHPADLSRRAQGRRADRRASRRDVLRDSRRARIRRESCSRCSTTCEGVTRCCERSCSRNAASS